MSKLSPPEFKMTLGGIDFSDPAMEKKVVEIEVEAVADGPDSFKVTLDDREDFFAGGGKIKESDSASIAMGYLEGQPPQEVLTGTVTGIDSFRREYRRQMYVIQGFCLAHRLTRGRHRCSWEQMKDSDLAPILAGEAGLGCEADDSGIIHPFIAQNNLTNLAFLYERARRIGFEVDVVKNTLMFKKPCVSGPVCTLTWDQSNIGNNSDARLLKRCKFASSTMGQVDEVTVRHYDPKLKKEIVGKSSDVHGQTMGGQKTGPQWASGDAPSLKIQVSDQPVRSVEEAEKLAWSILNQRAGSFMTGTGSCEGDNRIKPGKVVKVDGVGGEVNGDYYIVRCSHKMRMGAGPGYGYETEFEIRRSGR